MKAVNFHNDIDTSIILDLNVDHLTVQTLQSKLKAALENPIKEKRKGFISFITRDDLTILIIACSLFLIEQTFTSSDTIIFSRTFLAWGVFLISYVLCKTILEFLFYLFQQEIGKFCRIPNVHYTTHLTLEELQWFEFFYQCFEVFKDDLDNFQSIIHSRSNSQKLTNLFQYRNNKDFKNILKLVFKEDFKQIKTIQSKNDRMDEYKKTLMALIDNEDESELDTVLSFIDKYKSQDITYENLISLDNYLNHLFIQKIESPEISISKSLKRLSL